MTNAFCLAPPIPGPAIVACGPSLNQACFQAFLRHLRRAYADRPIWLILDRASAHTVPRSQGLAAALNVTLLWLPRQWSELNAMDQLWRELKGHISANHQFASIRQHAAMAQRWIFSLSKTETLRKAGVLTQNFWLRTFLQ
jgi:hypothetical protein